MMREFEDLGGVVGYLPSGTPAVIICFLKTVKQPTDRFDDAPRATLRGQPAVREGREKPGSKGSEVHDTVPNSGIGVNPAGLAELPSPGQPLLAVNRIDSASPTKPLTGSCSSISSFGQ